MAGVALSACTSTSETTSAKGAATTAAYPQLPDTIVTVPAAYAPDEGPSGSIAEASAIYAVAEARGTASDAPLMASLAPGEGAPPVPASFAGPTPSSAKLASLPLESSEPEGARTGPIHAPQERLGPGEVGARTPELDALMARYAEHYQIPEELVRHVAKRESTFNPKARNGPYWGLMQIRHDTAKGMGYQGSASGLLDAETNLKYAVRYLRGAWLVAKGDPAVADRLYRRGYYYDAKRAGLLDETGLGKDRRRRNPS